jgi:hypothetical protein
MNSKPDRLVALAAILGLALGILPSLAQARLTR